MKLLLIMLVLLSVAPLYAQVYNNPGGSITTCSGTFYDSGGAGGNYGDNQNITTTFCATAGQQLMFDFTSINIENGFDYINVYNGSSTASPLLGYISGVGTAQVFSTNGCLTFQFISDNSFNYSGWVANISCFTPADYTHPTTGIANEFVGSCIVNNCGPFTYTDNGGPAGNYSNSIGSTLYGGIYRVFCPSVAGSCMRATFNQYSTEAGYDYMTIGNGPTQNSPFFTTTPANALGRISGAPTVPFTYTSTDQSGCLTFRFLSDGINNAPGWNATLQCVPCAGGPTGLENSDCINSTAVCSNSSITALSHGPGLVSEYCNGTSCPAGGENYSNWYQFIPQTSGNLSINIVPTNPLDDFDFFIFQANSFS